MSNFATYPDDFIPYDTKYLLDRADQSCSQNTKKNKLILPNLDIEKRDRKTYIRNIKAISEKLNRPLNDIVSYFSTELRVSTSIKEDGSLKIDRIFHQSNLNPIYSNYVISLQCKGCKSIQTIETKEDRITYLECTECKRKVSK